MIECKCFVFVSAGTYERQCDISGCCRYIPKTRCRSFDIKYAGDSAGKGWAEGGWTRKLERAVVRDSKGWWIDRRRSVTRYSCQQAAGITSPFPPSVSSTIPSLCATLSLAHQPSRSLATDAGLPRNILHVNAASMFSQRRGLSMATPVPGSIPPSLTPVSRFPHIALLLSHARLQRFIPRSWNTAAVTPSLALIGTNCSIFFERRFWCIDLELIVRRKRYTEGSAESRPMSAEN